MVFGTLKTQQLINLGASGIGKIHEGCKAFGDTSRLKGELGPELFGDISGLSGTISPSVKGDATGITLQLDNWDGGDIQTLLTNKRRERELSKTLSRFGTRS